MERALRKLTDACVSLERWTGNRRDRRYARIVDQATSSIDPPLPIPQFISGYFRRMSRGDIIVKRALRALSSETRRCVIPRDIRLVAAPSPTPNGVFLFFFVTRRRQMMARADRFPFTESTAREKKMPRKKITFLYCDLTR